MLFLLASVVTTLASGALSVFWLGTSMEAAYVTYILSHDALILRMRCPLSSQTPGAACYGLWANDPGFFWIRGP